MSRLLRTAAVGLTVLASSALGMPAASAAPSVVLPLDPTEIGVFLGSPENDGLLTVDTPVDADPVFGPVPAEWGGGVTVQIPALFDGSAMDVTLELYSDPDSWAPARTYSNTYPAPDDLVLTDLGGGQYGVTLPADDGVSGTFGILYFEGLTSPVPGIDVTGPAYYLEFTGTGVSVQNLEPQIIALASLPCDQASMFSCPSATLHPGESFGLTVPPGSLLQALGLGTFDDLAVALDQYDEDGFPTGADTEMLSDRPGAVTVTGPSSATVTLPAETPAGSYGLTLLHSSGTDSVSITFGELIVEAIPRPAIENAGLHSDTGWEEFAATPGDAGGLSSSGLIALGGGMVVGAGALVAVALRPRRRDLAEPCEA